MILVHKGRKPPGPLEATPIPWEVQVWLQSQLFVIGDPSLSAADVAIRILQNTMERCGKRYNSLKVFEALDETHRDLSAELDRIRQELAIQPPGEAECKRCHRTVPWEEIEGCDAEVCERCRVDDKCCDACSEQGCDSAGGV